MKQRVRETLATGLLSTCAIVVSYAYPPWYPLKLMYSVPVILQATHTCLTSWGSAVARSVPTVFSILLAKTLPLLSQARQLGCGEGRANIIGPLTSAGVSAVTQLSSSRLESVDFVMTGLLEASLQGIDSSAWGTLRFLDFFSPLNCKGFTIVVV